MKYFRNKFYLEILTLLELGTDMGIPWLEINDADSLLL